MSVLLSTTLPLRTAALFVLWLLISESYNLPHMAIGLAASITVALLNTDRLTPAAYRIYWLRLAAYLPWLLWRIFVSGAHLSYLILHPRMPIDPIMFSHRTKLANKNAVVLLGNSVTLTPGTLTVEADPDEVLVHAMDEYSAQDVKTLRLDRKIANLFKRTEARR